jgi:hypothetical protein
MLIAAAIVTAGAALVPGEARGEGWQSRFVGYNSEGVPRYVRVYCYRDGRCVRARRYVAQQHRGTRVYSYVRRETDEDRGPGCREVRRAVGDQHLTVDGAKKAANDAWAATIRFHLGEKYMELANAKHVVYTCSRSSIKEGGVTTLGQTLNRCEIEATPCHPQRVYEANDTDKR